MRTLYRSRTVTPPFPTGPTRIVGPSDLPGRGQLLVGLGAAGPTEMTATSEGSAEASAAVLQPGVMPMAVVGSQLAGVGGSALYGGFVGGVASHSWKGATTGALAGASIAALSYGVINLINRGWLWGLLFAGGGAFGAYTTYTRWRKRR